MRDYKLNDEARDLYVNHNWSIKELENKYNQRMTDFVIPQSLRLDRTERLRARKQREIKNRRALARKAKKKPVKLNKAEKVKVKAMSNKIRAFDIKSMKINIKQCPVNLWLMGG